MILFYLGGVGTETTGMSIQWATAGTDQEQPPAVPGTHHRRKGGEREGGCFLVQCIRGKTRRMIFYTFTVFFIVNYNLSCLHGFLSVCISIKSVQLLIHRVNYVMAHQYLTRKDSPHLLYVGNHWRGGMHCSYKWWKGSDINFVHKFFKTLEYTFLHRNLGRQTGTFKFS